MGKVTSGTTIQVTAYVTERGREYLFNANNNRFDNSGNDLFKVEFFTLGDPDANYRALSVLPDGDVPDISGFNDSCLNSTTEYSQRSTLVFSGSIVPTGNVAYATNIQGANLLIDIDNL